MEFDYERGLALLGEPPSAFLAEASFSGALETEALRAIEVAWAAEDGRLVRAEPHPILGLQKAAAAAVAADDLPALLTKAWGRLCDASEAVASDDLCDRLQQLNAGAQFAGA